MLLRAVLSTALLTPPDSGCRGIQCASGECLPLGSTCPSLREAGLVTETPNDVQDPFVAAELRELRVQRREAKQQAESRAQDNFERAVFFNRLGFGLGAAAAFSAALGWFAGAAALKAGHTRGCKLGADILAGYGAAAASCPDRVPGYALSLTVGVGFTLAGLVFSIIAANSPARVARRMGRLTFGFAGAGVRF